MTTLLAASLGEMIHCLGGDGGVRVPGGFAVTAEAFRRTVDPATLEVLKTKLGTLDTRNSVELAAAGAACRELMLSLPMTKEVEAAVRDALRAQPACESWAVRSSATAEDLPGASFAGQHDSFLNIGAAQGEQGVVDVLRAIKRCHASLFTDRAISYRVDKVGSPVCFLHAALSPSHSSSAPRSSTRGSIIGLSPCV